MQVNSFHELKVWQRAMDLTVEIYRLTRELPLEERFGLSNQLRRAAVSIPSNIAEGAAFGRRRRNLHHVRIALGSNLELQTQLLLLERLQLIKQERLQTIVACASDVGRMLNGLARSHAI